jgi:hypothetical protein
MIDHVALQNEPIAILEVPDGVLTIANAVEEGVHTLTTKQHVVSKTTDQNIISRTAESCSATGVMAGRIASSRNAPERVRHCLTRMLPARRHFVNRHPTGIA